MEQTEMMEMTLWSQCEAVRDVKIQRVLSKVRKIHYLLLFAFT